MRTLPGLTLGLLLCTTAGVQADEQAPARAVLDQAIRAHGGAAALQRAQLQARQVSGSMHFIGRSVPFTADMVLALPGRYRASFELNNPDQRTQMTLALNRDKGWRSTMGAVAEVSKEELEELQEEAHLMWLATLLPLKDSSLTLTLVPGAKVEDQAVNCIQVTSPGRADVKLYFDKNSHLLIKADHRAREAGIMVNKEHLYSGYKNVQGAYLPSREVQVSNGKKTIELIVKLTKFLPRVDDSLFARP